MKDTQTLGELKQCEQDIEELQEDTDALFKISEVMFNAFGEMSDKVRNLEKTNIMLIVIDIAFILAATYYVVFGR